MMDAPMEVSLFRMDLAYEVPFKRPIFEIARPGAPILRAYYDALNPRFPLSMSDLQAPSAATSFGDVLFRVVLFAGSGVLETTLTRFYARFERIQSQQDLKVVSDCVNLSEQALKSAATELEPIGARIMSASWLSCEGGAEAANAFLTGMARTSVDLRAESYGASSVIGTIGAELVSGEDLWSARFRIEKSLMERAHIFYHFEINHLQNGRFGSFEERTQHAESLYLLILNRLGITTKGQAEPPAEAPQ
jgi:hypothetical protein